MTDKPIVLQIHDTAEDLNDLEHKILPQRGDKATRVISKYPTVYIHNWTETGKYEVYVGESNDVFRRTREHYDRSVDPKAWQAVLRDKARRAMLYIIGHDHFNKSMTLDIENRLMHYLSGVESVRLVHNLRDNPQREYYPAEELDDIFHDIWSELHAKDEELFPPEHVVQDSAIFKASPLHRLTDAQEDAKQQILQTIKRSVKKHEKQIIFIDGEAGTGKTVLNSSTFYELYCSKKQEQHGDDSFEFNCCMIVNHDEQAKVYEGICEKFGIKGVNGKAVACKATRFLNEHPEEDSVDVAFVDEAHLLFTVGNQGYQGKNQLDDIVKRAKVTVIVFDENQILRMDQYWESEMLNRYREQAIAQGNHITLREQLRMQADPQTLHWIDSFTINGRVEPIPHGDYEIRVFDTPLELEIEIRNKAKHEETRLSRLIANYDWDYKQGKAPGGHLLKYWEVLVGSWHRPWNYELEKELNAKQKREIRTLAWAEQDHTIGEVGSTYTIQGFDLSYAGVILGHSVKYRDGHIVFDPSESSNAKVRINRTMEDGTKQNFAIDLLRHEVRVLLTRGVKGLYIYACDDELRRALKAAM